MFGIVTAAGAEYIKTSIGFAAEDATFHTLELMNAYVGAQAKIKAAGGIASFEDAETFLSLGASSLGTSRLVKEASEETG